MELSRVCPLPTLAHIGLQEPSVRGTSIADPQSVVGAGPARDPVGPFLQLYLWLSARPLP